VQRLEKVLEEQALNLIEVRQRLLQADTLNRDLHFKYKNELFSLREENIRLQKYIRCHKSDGELRRNELQRTINRIRDMSQGRSKESFKAKFVDLREQITDLTVAVNHAKAEIEARDLKAQQILLRKKAVESELKSYMRADSTFFQ
jgi:hypothetical protein